MKPWHVYSRMANHGRALVKPKGLWDKIVLWVRGWHPWHYGWWTVESRRLKESRRH